MVPGSSSEDPIGISYREYVSKSDETYLLRNRVIDTIGLHGALPGGGFLLHPLYRLGGRTKQVRRDHSANKAIHGDEGKGDTHCTATQWQAKGLTILLLKQYS